MSTKVHIVKAMVFPVVMFGCERWFIKTVKHQALPRKKRFIKCVDFVASFPFEFSKFINL